MNNQIANIDTKEECNFSAVLVGDFWNYSFQAWFSSRTLALFSRLWVSYVCILNTGDSIKEKHLYKVYFYLFSVGQAFLDHFKYMVRASVNF